MKNNIEHVKRVILRMPLSGFFKRIMKVCCAAVPQCLRAVAHQFKRAIYQSVAALKNAA